jgi:hypothetical protein
MRLRGLGEPFERDAHPLVVALPGVDAQQEFERLDVFGVARERLAQDFQQRRFLPSVERGFDGAREHAHGLVDVAAAQVEAGHLEEQREVGRVGRDQRLGRALGGGRVLGVHVGARQHRAQFQVAGTLGRGALQNMRGLVGLS